MTKQELTLEIAERIREIKQMLKELEPVAEKQAMEASGPGPTTLEMNGVERLKNERKRLEKTWEVTRIAPSFDRRRY
jgi:hypothetical protein